MRRGMRIRWLWILLIFVNIIGLVFPAFAADTANRNPLDWMDKLEVETLGKTTQGNLLDRLDCFEEMLVGRVREGSIIERLTYLDTLLYTNQPYDISINYKIQALEWVLFHRSFSDPLEMRTERLEKTLFGTSYSSPIAGRLEKMVNQIFTDGTVKGHWTSVSEGTLVKVKILEAINSSKSQPGDRFRFEVTETLFNNDLVIIPQGSTGYGSIVKVVRPRSLGIDARVVLDFNSIRALDGTPIDLFYGSKASEMNHSRKLAVGASTAGMLILGPEGILVGMVIKGREKTIPANTEFYVQVAKPVRIHTLQK